VFQTRLTADVADGSRQVSVSTTEADQAVTASGSRTIDIVQRTPTLTAATNPEGNETVIITGQLTGPDGTPLADQTLSVGVRNETTARIETTADGTYEYSISREALPANASVVAVQYSPGVSNLAPVTADAALPVQATGAQVGLLSTVQQRPLLVIVLFGTFVSGLSGGVYLYRRRKSPGRSTEERDPTATQSESETDTSKPESSRPTLAAARAARDRGELNEAVITAYTAVRTEITAQYSVSPQTTHWQFYHTVADHNLPIARDLETLTTHYETAQYAPGSIPSETARELLTTAETIHTTLQHKRDDTDSEVEQ
jgi:nucleotide-binding universal stress UspA family protein